MRRGRSAFVFVGVAVLAAAGVTAVTALRSPSGAAVAADPVTAAQAARVVAQYQGSWASPPTTLANGETPDGPLLGNGDVGVVEGGGIDRQTFYLGKNDFFSTSSHAIQPLGRVVLAVPGLVGSTYHVTQDIAHAQVKGTYTKNGSTLATTSWVSATENLFVTSLVLTGGSNQAATITLQNGTGGTPTVSSANGTLDADVTANPSPQARVAARVVGGASSVSGSTISFTLQPNVTYTLTAAVVSSIDQAGYQAAADTMVSTADLNALGTAHASWWQNYWAQSFVEIPDKNVEKSWYGSLYLLGSVSRTGKYAPGLWGNWITGNMNWNGDYHTNYNYETPFYAGLSTNHVAQTDPYDKPVLDWLTAGQNLARQNGFQGVLYPVGLSPLGTSADLNLHNQKSNAAYVASNMVLRYEYTRDPAYASQVYPFLKQVGLFWQNYLTLDQATGLYVINNDAPQEDNAYPQVNSIVSLGLVHLLLQGLVDMSTALNQDAGTRTTWQTLNSKLSPFPTMSRNGVTVFRETSTGAAFVTDGNDIDIQETYPGSQIGLDSDQASLATARNTIDQLDAWHGGNAPGTLYPAAARVGYNPATILSNLDGEATANAYPNLAIHHNGGGIENLNVVPSGLDEMLLQSFQNDVKVFADWPTGTPGKFGDLLAYGDFLVSSSVTSSAVQYVHVVSQRGGALTLTNPWPGQSVQVYRNGTDAGTLTGARVTTATSAGDTLDLAPAGTPVATIQQELAQPLQVGSTATFGTGFEAGNPSPTWTDSVDTSSGGLVGVTGICCGAAGPETGVRSGETAHAGSGALMYSGSAQGGNPHAYLKVFDLGGAPLSVGSSKTLSYWIYPQSHTTSTWVPVGSTDSTCVAVDLVFTDGSTLRDSGAVDQGGNQAHPAHQCGRLSLDAWNHVTVALATHSAGKQISRILVGYDHPGGTGGYRGYVDDLAIS